MAPLRNTFISTTTANRSILNILSCYVETGFSRQPWLSIFFTQINNEWFPAFRKVKQHSLDYDWINDYNNNSCHVKLCIVTVSAMAAMTAQWIINNRVNIYIHHIDNKAHPDMCRNASPVLVLSVLNRRHFDYWADFHTDSATVFTYF